MLHLDRRLVDNEIKEMVKYLMLQKELTESILKEMAGSQLMKKKKKRKKKASKLMKQTVKKKMKKKKTIRLKD